MDIESYIASGIIEMYCLGLASPAEKSEVESLRKQYAEVEAEIRTVTRALEKFALGHAQLPPPTLKHRILNEIDLLNWEKSRLEISQADSIPGRVRDLLPTGCEVGAEEILAMTAPEDYPNVYLRELAKNDSATSWILWVKRSVNPEIHQHLVENFLILRGTCELTVEGKVYYLSAGDFTCIPVGQHHSLVVTSDEPLVAFFQRVRI